MFDVLVVGAGLAGLSAALRARKSGLSVALMSKNAPFRSNSSMASGGINAALGYAEYDASALHIADTIKSAAGLGDEKAIKLLCETAPSIALELDALGAAFNRAENGKLAQRSFGGSGKKRACYVQDRTGAALVQALLKACNENGVKMLHGYFLLKLLVKNNRVGGVYALKVANGEVTAIEAKSVVLAGGGYAGIYCGYTSNPLSTSGDVLAVAFRAGLRLVNMEFVQFHPTGLLGSGELVSEAARSEGGFLTFENGERFTDEMQTRDKLARSIERETRSGRRVYIDARRLGKAFLESRLPNFCKSAAAKLGLDPSIDLIPIAPSAHYTMGGIEVYARTKTAIKGLFACGECAHSGTHGANRLGGNSLLEAAVFGKIAGENAVTFAKRAKSAKRAAIDAEAIASEQKRIDRIIEGESRFNINALRKSLGKKLTAKLGVFRDASGLKDALEYAEYLQTLVGGLACVYKERTNNVELVMILEFLNALEIAEVMALAALRRKESRGAHFREDYPLSDDSFLKNSYASRKNDGFYSIDFLRPRSFAWFADKLRRALSN
ncbi:MAG: FAD-dependent oxidoreductase [Helicobacteraceae bacterium]|jgi:succinate dehydrogenase / fumarate reductase flavoprotein subunit|nr:FAD-dependent oxidoreductase [Helicobacteraceae bacterium]